MLSVRIFINADVAGHTEPGSHFDHEFFEAPGTDHSTEDIDHRQVPVPNAMEQDHVSDEVRVGLLPERLLALAPY
jgi:hypothetical protein